MGDRYEGMCVSLPVVVPADIAEEAKAAERAAAAKRRRFIQRLKPSGTKIDVS